MNLKQITDQFFSENRELLEMNYPGINEFILLRELSDIFLVGADEYFYFDQSWNHLKTQLLSGIPFAYLKHRGFFYDAEFFLNQSCLIPRFESELLVESAINELKNISSCLSKLSRLSVLDYGCGAGNLLLSVMIGLSQYPFHAVGIDIEKKCLLAAKTNQHLLGHRFHPQSNISWINSNVIYNTETSAQVFDLIITNPPYIKFPLQQKDVHTKVNEFEPHTALYVDENLYHDFFENIFEGASKILNKENGILLMETHEDNILFQAEQAKKFFDKVTVISDLTGRNRILLNKNPK